jgi:hypothetical protein
MRYLLLAGGSVLALASPALAQQAAQTAPAQSTESADAQLDTLVPEDNQAEAPAEATRKVTGDAVRPLERA